MTIERNELANLFKAVAGVLSEMSDNDYKDLLNGNGKLEYSSKNNEKTKNRIAVNNDDSYVLNAVENLNQFINREEAETFLLKNNVTKSDLIKIASILDIYLNKSVSKEKIIDKIVESTVGARIRSQAIKDTKLKNIPDSNRMTSINDSLK